MSYMLLILEQHGDREKRGLEAGKAAYAAMVEYGQSLHARGVLRGGNALRKDDFGVRLTERNGRRTLIDGPFTESKEMIGGFFLVDCTSKEEALALAAECPARAWATVEVREIGTCYDDLN